MPKPAKDNLFQLVKSLSKSEKRQFKLYVGRLEGNEDSKFLQLFNILDRLSTYQEDLVLDKIGIGKRQLPNLKAHLYRQILVSLRLSPSQQNVRTQLREQLDFATILYRKGLYNQSLKLLDRAKNQALEYEEKLIASEIIELEKVIESQYITRSIRNRADQLIAESEEVTHQNVLASKLSNLSLDLYSEFLKSGYAKNEQEYERLKNFFNARLPSYDIADLGLREKLWLYKVYLWYSFLIQDFRSCYRYASKWVSLFETNEKMIQTHPVFYLRGQQYLLESLFFIQDRKRFTQALEQLENRLGHPNFPKDDNVNSLSFLYLYSHKMNQYFLEGEFANGLSLVNEVEDGINQYGQQLDEHHIMVFNYKIACMYFGAWQLKKCIEYLDRIISNKSLKMREDLLCFARILNLVAHYEAGMDYHLDSLIKSTYKYLIKMEDLYEVQKEMIRFLRGLGDIYPHQIKDAFRELHGKLKQYEDHPYERRSFLYLDILSWLESNIEKRPIQDIIQEKIRIREQIST
ncbi:hypothetical protein [Aureitalea marina]|uniref:MalT-like TPR region domain-containing protein n=1 Tax=Aureitalea marina TaxID=930804 RepID=A0A2S7KM06_9FLAO|nr:hypothetical protein [Aureitalea marina]PQB03638.1 hypothetical protein BST85_01020 [Aureitalea marina]